MAALGKYIVIEAINLESRKRHRILIEEMLKKNGLSPEARADLEWDLRRAKDYEYAALRVVEDLEAEVEEEKEKEKGGDSSSGSGDQGGGGSSSGSSGDGGGIAYEVAEQTEDTSNFELLALLMYLAEKDISQPSDNLDVTQTFSDSEPALAAATLLFNRQEQVAHIHEPYTSEAPNELPNQSELLPVLEAHAVTIGARMVQLKAHPEAVDALQRKFGYEPHGKPVNTGGQLVQRMRKRLSNAHILKAGDPS